MKAHKAEHRLVGSSGKFAKLSYDTLEIFSDYMRTPGIRIGVDHTNIGINSRVFIHRDTDCYPNNKS